VKIVERSGDFVTLREVVDEVGTTPFALRCCTATERRVLDSSVAKVIEQSRDNPVFYVSTGRKGHSILRNAREESSPICRRTPRRVWLISPAPRSNA